MVGQTEKPVGDVAIRRDRDIVPWWMQLRDARPTGIMGPQIIPAISEFIERYDSLGMQRYGQTHQPEYYQHILAVASNLVQENPRKITPAKLAGYGRAIKTLSDGNVGIANGGENEVIQSGIDNSLSFLRDGLMWFTHPNVYDRTITDLQHNLPFPVTEIYNSRKVMNEVLAAKGRSIGMIRQWKREHSIRMFSGVKPVYASAIEAMRSGRWGREMGVVGGFHELQNRLANFETSLSTGAISHEELRAYDKSIIERYDRLRCRVYMPKAELSEWVGTLRLDWALPRALLSPLLGKRLDYYMSEWIYRADGALEDSELKGEDFPRSINRYYQNLMQRLGPGDLVYSALHTHIPAMIHGKPIAVELQVAPQEMEPMHRLAEVVYKQEDPGLAHVAPELIQQTRDFASRTSQ